MIPKIKDPVFNSDDAETKQIEHSERKQFISKEDVINIVTDTSELDFILPNFCDWIPEDYIIDNEVRSLLWRMLHGICKRIDKLPVITQDAGCKGVNDCGQQDNNL